MVAAKGALVCLARATGLLDLALRKRDRWWFAALYVQRFQDTVLLDAVDDVEDLTVGLSRKI